MSWLKKKEEVTAVTDTADSREAEEGEGDGSDKDDTADESHKQSRRKERKKNKVKSESSKAKHRNSHGSSGNKQRKVWTMVEVEGLLTDPVTQRIDLTSHSLELREVSPIIMVSLCGILGIIITLRSFTMC